MRNYWLKIAAGALGIFAAGMLLNTAFKSASSKVTSAINSSDPIPIPLIGLVPFRLDGEKLGRLSRVEFVRSGPKHVSGVRVLVKLADSADLQRLRACQFAIDDVEHIDENTTFRCQGTQGPVPGLEPFGRVIINGSPDTLPLLLPSRAVSKLRRTTIQLDHSGLHIETPPDPVAEALQARTDSLQELFDSRVDARSDSVDSLRDLAEALEDSSTSLGVVERRRLQRSADSVRTVMRAMVDRMKADEAQLRALEKLQGLDVDQIDSLARLGSRINDSVQQVLARQLQRVRVEVERAEALEKVEAPPAANPR
jgi:hypothetical protein